METGNPTYSTTDEYIGLFPPDIQERLNAVRQVIREEAPEAGEKIGYAMPTFTLHGNLVHFAAFKQHIGFYPGASGVAAFQEELSAYKGAKGSIQFPLDKPIPFDLIRRIVRYRVAENTEKALSKGKKK